MGSQTSCCGQNWQIFKDNMSQMGQQTVGKHVDNFSNRQQKLYVDYVQELKQDFILIKSVIYINQLYKVLHIEKRQSLEKVAIDFVKNKLTIQQLNQANRKENYQDVGFQAIAQNKVAICTLAGGQSTRLGSKDPKGMFNIGLNLTRSLFEYFSHKIIALQNLCKSKKKIQQGKKVQIKWYIMTNQLTQRIIQEYFQSNKYFGLNSKQVKFFAQKMLPAVDHNGQVIFQSKIKIFTAPNGNGGIFYSLKQKGILAEMKLNGIEHIHITNVDNILMKLADPVAIGYHILNKAQITSKYIAKKHAHQKVGVHVLINQKPSVYQYSQMPQSMSEQIDQKTKQLKYNDSYIGSFFISVQFLDLVIQEFVQKFKYSYIIAKKKIPYYDIIQNVVVNPQIINGYKFQMLIFKIFQLAQKFQLIETIRQEQFAPMKNKQGEDSPESARRLLWQLNRRWLKSYGLQIDQQKACEIEGTLTYNGQGLQEYIKKYNKNLSVILLK